MGDLRSHVVAIADKAFKAHGQKTGDEDEANVVLTIFSTPLEGFLNFRYCMAILPKGKLAVLNYMKSTWIHVQASCSLTKSIHAHTCAGNRFWITTSDSALRHLKALSHSSNGNKTLPHKRVFMGCLHHQESPNIALEPLFEQISTKSFSTT